MTTDEAKRIQTRLGVTADGEIGRQSWAGLFRKFGAGPERAAELALAANIHCPANDISTPLRMAHFMAQLAHESGGFRFMEEIASGQAYEGRKDLGNTQPGDGRRYKGRGPIQCTGRANYRKYGQKLGIDLEAHPEIVAHPSVGMIVACLYWDEHDINAAADLDDVEKVTRKINGGLNGLADRKKHLAAAKAIFL